MPVKTTNTRTMFTLHKKDDKKLKAYVKRNHTTVTILLNQLLKEKGII